MLYVTGTGFVGAEAAVSFKDFVSRYEFLLTPEDILDRNQWKRAEGTGVSEKQPAGYSAFISHGSAQFVQLKHRASPL